MIRAPARLAAVIGLVVFGLVATSAMAQARSRFDVAALSHPGSANLAFPMIAARGDRVVASTVGPVLWASGDGGRSFSAPRTPNPLDLCTNPLPGTADVAVAADGVLYAVQQCFGLGGSVLIWRSRDGGASWAPPSGGSVQILAAGMESSLITTDPADPRTIYVVGEALDLTTLIVWKSTDGGRSFAPRPINLPRSLEQVTDDGPSISTRLLVDPSDRRRLYVMWWSIAKREIAQLQGVEGLHDYEFATKAFAAVSSDAGATWRVREIVDTGGPAPSLPPPSHEKYHDLANWLPAGAVDDAGTVYLALAEQRPHTPGAHITLMSSRDHGATWSQRTQADRGPNATFAPAVVAGSAGRVGIAFMQADRPAALDPQAQWSLRYAFSSRASAAHPRFATTRASDPLLTAAVCPLGGGPHSCASRTLSVVGDGRGRALILANRGMEGTREVVLSRRVDGPTLRTRPAPKTAKSHRRAHSATSSARTQVSRCCPRRGG